MPKPYRIAFIDDNSDDLRTVPTALAGPGLNVEPLLYADVNVASIASKFDMFLLDFALVNRPTHAHKPAFGTTAASQLRETAPHKPIVLVTSGKLVDAKGLVALVEGDMDLDDLWRKEKLEDRPAEFRDRCVLLIRGYVALGGGRNRKVSWSKICKASGAGERDAYALSQANPPHFPPSGSTWQVFEAAHWLRYVVLAYPGILYDPLHAACALGISLASFRSSPMAKLFSRARYAGPFVPVEGRWWKSKLRAIASETLGTTGAPLHNFGVIWNSKGHKKVALSRCCVDHKSIGNCVCHILKRPVATSNSFPYSPDLRPTAVMDEARVSFTAVRESNEFDEDLVPPDSRRLALEHRVGRYTE